MAFLSDEEINKIPFKHLGKGVLISEKASIYTPELMEIGDYSRIDDFCVLSGRIAIGRNVHIAVFCNVAGGSEGVFIGDFSGLSYNCQVFSQSDDYSGKTLTNPTVPIKYKAETRRSIRIGRHCIIGTSSIIFPGVSLADGTAVGAASVVRKSTDEWSIYIGNPAKRVKARSKDLLLLEVEFLKDREAN